jgi:nucleoside-diphosphate-sugar epimerase
MATEKIFVTGAPGWLGNRFVEMLTEKKRDVRCLVLKNMDYSYLKKLGAEAVEGDITRPETLNNVASDVETVFHLAGIIHPKLFGGGDFFKINTHGTKNMLDAAIKSGAKRFVYISSNSPVGVNYDRNILMNEYTFPKPYMNYGRSKLLAEKAVNEAFVQGKIETVIIRPCWYYGPGQPKRQTRLMKMIKEGRALLFGDGTNLRSMTYIENLCDAMLLAEKSKIASGETYWIADERPYTTIEIYNVIASLLGVDLRIRKIPGMVSDAVRIADSALQKLHLYQQEIHVAGEMNVNIACSIEKAKKDLGYKPRVDLKEGMKRSIDWAKKQGMI